MHGYRRGEGTVSASSLPGGYNPPVLALALLAFLPVQAEELVERLGSDQVEEREEAIRGLKKLGKAAVPALEKASAGGDPEVIGRAKLLLKTIGFMDRLTPELRKAIPGIEDRLAASDGRAWTRLLLQAGERWTLVDRPYRQLQAKDLDPLAAPALAGAVTTQDKIDVSNVIQAARLRSGAPGLIEYLKDADALVRLEAIGALGSLDAKAAAPEIRKQINDPNPLNRLLAVHALGELGAKEAVPDLVPLLKDPDGDLKSKTVDVLVILGAKEAVPELLDLIKEGLGPDTAARQLGWLRAKEAIPSVRALLVDGDIDVRLAAAWALGRMGSDAGFPLAVAQLDHAVPRVRSEALRIVAEFEVKGAIHGLVRMLANRDLSVPAGRGLCRLGSREGVGPIFEGWGTRAEQEDDGFWLNALRARETCDRLLKKEWTESLEGTGREVLERLAREAELPLEWSPKAPGGEPNRLEPGWKRGRSTLLEAIADAGSPFGIVLEKDRIRVLEKEESLAFWRAWWEAEKKK